MTREEMKLLYAKDKIRSWHIDYIFDKIDDFESRTCENCKYFDKDDWESYDFVGVRCEELYVEFGGKEFDYKKDGCNRFEIKDTK